MTLNFAHEPSQLTDCSNDHPGLHGMQENNSPVIEKPAQTLLGIHMIDAPSLTAQNEHTLLQLAL